jgi:hypothetical protein
MEREALQSSDTRREAHVEPSGDGGKMIVKTRVWERDGLREVVRTFDSLEEALAFAQRFYEAA